MHVNPKFLKALEELCLVQQGYRSHSSRFHRDFQDFDDFYSFQDGENFHNADSCRKENKRYDLSNIRSDDEFKMCLGSEFLDMDLSILDMKHKKHGLSHYLEMDDNNYDDHLMPFMMNRNKKVSKKEIEETFEFKLMNFEGAIQMAHHAMRELFIVRDMLNCTPLIAEWFSFAKQQGVNIDAELAPVLQFLEKDKAGFKIYKQLKADFNSTRDESLDFLNKGHRIMRKLLSNNPNNRFEGFIHPREFMPYHDAAKSNSTFVVEPEIFQELETLQTKLNRLKNDMRESLVYANNDSFNATEIRNNNDVLITALFSAYNKLKDNIKLPVTKAKFFIEDVTVLVPNKIYDEKAVNTHLEKNKKAIMLANENISYKNTHYKKVVIFEDNSCAVLVDGQERFEVFTNIKETKHLVRVSISSYLKNILRKNPTIAKVISTAFEKNIEKINANTEHYYDRPLQLSKILLSIDTYFKNENILKASKFDFIEICKTAASFEKVDDTMHKIIREHKIKKYAESIVSSKYKHLYNAKSYKLFKELYDLGIDLKIVQDMIGKKLAAVETEKMFNEHIKSLINSFNDFDMESIKIKAVSNKVNVISDTDNILILEISDFEQSKRLGSGSWCISRNKTYFDQYVERDGKQYFIYDFNQTSKSVKSLVGITLTSTKAVKAAHSKSDGHFNDKKMIDYLIDKVKQLEEIEKPPVVAIKKTRKKKVTNVTDIATLNIGF